MKNPVLLALTSLLVAVALFENKLFVGSEIVVAEQNRYTLPSSSRLQRIQEFSKPSTSLDNGDRSFRRTISGQQERTALESTRISPTTQGSRAERLTRAETRTGVQDLPHRSIRTDRHTEARSMGRRIQDSRRSFMMAGNPDQEQRITARTLGTETRRNTAQESRREIQSRKSCRMTIPEERQARTRLTREEVRSVGSNERREVRDEIRSENNERREVREVVRSASERRGERERQVREMERVTRQDNRRLVNDRRSVGSEARDLSRNQERMRQTMRSVEKEQVQNENSGRISRMEEQRSENSRRLVRSEERKNVARKDRVREFRNIETSNGRETVRLSRAENRVQDASSQQEFRRLVRSTERRNVVMGDERRETRRAVRSEERVRDDARQTRSIEESNRLVRAEERSRQEPRRMVRSEERVRDDAHQSVRSEQRVRDASRRETRSEERVRDASRRKVRSEERVREDVPRVVRSEEQARDISRLEARSEERVRDASRRMVRSEERVRDASRREVRSEERVRDASRQMVRSEERVRDDARQLVRSEERVRDVSRRMVRSEDRVRDVSRRMVRSEGRVRDEARRTVRSTASVRDDVRRMVRTEDKVESSRTVGMVREAEESRTDTRFLGEAKAREISDQWRSEQRSVRSDLDSTRLENKQIISNEKSWPLQSFEDISVNDKFSSMGSNSWNQVASAIFGGAALLLAYSQQRNSKLAAY